MKKILTLFLFPYTIWTSSAQQTNLNLGKIAFIAYNSDGSVPDGTGNNQFGFVCLLDIASFSPGIYVLRLTSDSSGCMEKIVVTL